jgi:hypothetical protein
VLFDPDGWIHHVEIGLTVADEERLHLYLSKKNDG